MILFTPNFNISQTHTLCILSFYSKQIPYFCGVKKILILFLCFVGLQTHAQITLKGRIFDSNTIQILSPVSIENLTTHTGSFSDEQGNFSITGKAGDNILFTYVGYKNKTIQLRPSFDNVPQQILLTLKTIQLNNITIRRGLSEYQQDSVHRASIYKDAFDYEQTKSVFTPITSVYQKFSKKYKNLRKFQNQIIQTEQQKFIDSRYSTEMVGKLTHLEGDSLANFMNAYPMEFDYARQASEVEIKMWVKYNFQDYTQKKK